MDDIPTYYNGTVYTQWEAPAPNSTCTLIIINEEETYTDISLPTEETHLTSTLPQKGIYYRFLRCLVDPDTGKNATINIGYFKVYMHPRPHEETPEELSPIPIEISETYTDGYMPSDYTEETKIDTEEVLGTEKERCNITLQKDKQYKVNEWDCNLGIQITKTEYMKYEEYFSLNIQGIYSEKIYANVQVYSCKPFSIVDFDTWFKCKKRLIDWFRGEIEPIYIVNGNTTKDGVFNISSISKDDISRKRYNITFEIHFSYKSIEWTDWMYTQTEYIEIPEAKQIERKPFIFPLDQYIGVTQWYGCTQYQCPHGGIDFGARLNKVLSIGDGVVQKVGYDKYGGECNQGGNFVLVKHTNGMYSAYFHLKEYSVKNGDFLQKGDTIGISGNSGKWNCQNLGYHLHFATRKNIYSSSHTNPVPYINIDWNMIPTLGKDMYPKRLSGENPHPNY